MSTSHTPDDPLVDPSTVEPVPTPTAPPPPQHDQHDQHRPDQSQQDQAPSASSPVEPDQGAPESPVEPVEPGAAVTPPTPPAPPGPVEGERGTDDEDAFPAYPVAEFPGYGAPTYGQNDQRPPEAVAGDRPGSLVCPRCSTAIEAWAGFCEACGQTLTPTAPMPLAPAASEGSEASEGSTPTRPVRRRAAAVPQHPCAECGGRIGEDLYCEQCGAKAPSARDHFREAPADWVAGVCDRGIKHHRNEDAMALAADDDPEQGRAVLIVCDGVSNSDDSHLVSLPAARVARDLLVDRSPVDADAFTAAVAAANEAVIDHTDLESLSPGSCTFAGAVIEAGVITFGNIGDARVYWIDDQPGASRLLSLDDSVAQARIAMGVDRHTAENGPQAHAITRWLGRDAPDLVPTTGTLDVPGDGWVLVCSDGLWNYASDPEALHELAVEAIRRNAGNQRVRSLAVSLVRWARHQGGKDNITVALARLGDFAHWPEGTSPATAPAAPTVPVEDSPAP